ncbi:hypothetical protein Patl1_01434 [Pistacia atlantica]|uniref:Uncharacterized protein n=1 Tax=Pistacia atlantica TaxID=434234 RepID=A0ACC1CBD1_9ROSI|nr:hypothetical protein Patl1_01434 [Pistacia atlantica]
MGKKISKNPHEKKQLNSLIKVLRPKVYITDSSSFKNLVQELTGNGNTTTAVSSPPDSTYNPDQTTVDQISTIHIEDDVHVHAREPESSLEASSDASTESSFEPCNQQVLFPEELEQSYCRQIYLQGESNVTSSEYLLMNQQEEEIVIIWGFGVMAIGYGAIPSL